MRKRGGRRAGPVGGTPLIRWIAAIGLTLFLADYAALLGRFQALGYDSLKFRKFIQTSEQIGQPGFWSDGVKPAAG